MKAEDVLRCLRNRFTAPEWAFAAELSLVPGFIRGRRADAVALNCWSSGKWGLSFLGLEIKVSRGDFLHELKHPKKRAETYPDVDGIFFATPKGLVAKAEIPADCGLIECWTKDEAQPTLPGVKASVSTIYYTRIQKYPDGFKTAMDHMEWNATLNLHKAPRLSRAVAVAVIRGFDPDRINDDAVRDSHNLKYQIKELKGDLRYAKSQLEDAESRLKALEPKEQA